MFCFVIRDECKGEDCRAWKDEDCILIKFLENVGLAARLYVLDMNARMTRLEEREEPIIPEPLRICTDEDLAAELLELVRDDPRSSYGRISYEKSEEFWKSKGVVSKFNLPEDIRNRITNVESLTAKTLKDIRDERLEKEKEQVSNIADECVSWLRGQGVKGVIAKANVEMFLNDRDLDLLPETESLIYKYANTKSKSR